LNKSKAFKKPNPGAARLLVFNLVTQVNREGAYANLRLPYLLGESKLDQRDKSFATELAYGTIRMQGRHDFAIAEHSDRKIEEIDPDVIDLLRIGIHQLHFMRVSPHAAVSETVELARLVVGESKATFINAILRKIGADENLFKRVEANPELDEVDKFSILYSHPKWIVSAFYDQLRDWESVRSLLIANNTPVAPNLVAWPGKSTVDELLETGGEKLRLGSYSVLSSVPPSEYRAIWERRAGVQDCGSAKLTEIFFDTKSDADLNWLDMCAGPGGKAALLDSLIKVNKPNDKFIANEISQHRADLLANVIPRQQISVLDGTKANLFGQKFDRILIDAPCSGLGALRRRPEARWRKNPTDLKGLLELQRNLLNSGVELLKDGGILAYATCSPHLLETKGQVLDFLHRHKQMRLAQVGDFVSDIPEALTVDGNLQFWTHLDSSDSMFMALFRKEG
jgi:16S rRNA (cytosine967-C5)-methyltransferase